MLLRVIVFLLWQCAGAGAGLLVSPLGRPWEGAFAGTVIAGLFWLAWDTLRSRIFLGWIRADDFSDLKLRGGFWGTLSERVRKAIRLREQAIAESERRLHDFLLAMQASPTGVVLLDSGGHIEWFNHTAAGHFGLDPARDLQQLMVNLVRDPAFTRYVASREYRVGVTMQGREHTSTHPVRLSVHLHDYGEGRRLLLSRDVTMFEQAEAMRRDFVANVSHEIRTPLTVLSGFVETLQTLQLEDSERARYLDLMAQQAGRMQSLVNDLLTLSRLEGSPLPGEGEWIGVRPLQQQLHQEAQALVHVLASRHGDGTQRLVFDAAPEAEVSGSPLEIHSALANLVSNAIRYTPGGGEVRCRWTRLSDGRLEFSVEDTGPGIAAEHIPRLTERFYRVDRSRSRDTGGTGLGLAIVKHVAQRHGAELKIDSVIGRGSRFALVFPGFRWRPVQVPSAIEAGAPAA